ncbi:ATP-binding cassette domain-containing protein [Flavobacteriaceae bacterium]|nr:ATP-binding cassette domain-containing protein [Flavobacteriaceae bacterium]
MNKNLVTLENINFRIPHTKNHILEDISFKIDESDFITIIGPNGAGKTTLLKIILNIIKPTSGILKKDNSLKIGYVPQKFHIPQTIPINVSYFLKLNQKINHEIFHKTIHELKIEKLLDKQLISLSGGEMQKILLARSLLNQPNLIILDEAAQNLDISGQLEFYELINKIHQENKISILMISHDLHMVMSSTKKVICLFKHICCQGEPHVVAQNPEFISIFGQNMSKLVSIYNHHHDHNHG